MSSSPTAIVIEPSFVPKLAKKARLRFDRHSNKHMIVYPERGLELNDSAAEIAKRCDGTRTVEQIVKEMIDGVALVDDQKCIEADVLGFLTHLAEKGLLER